MFGPAFIHRRIKPIFDALNEAGFRLNTGSVNNLRSSTDEWEAKWGIGGFTVEFANGILLSVIDYYLKGDEPKWEIGIFRDNCRDWFSEGNLREYEDGFFMWRFDFVDLQSCLDSFETLAVNFGK